MAVPLGVGRGASAAAGSLAVRRSAGAALADSTSLRERRRVARRDLGERLAVELDARPLEARDQLAVG